MTVKNVKIGIAQIATFPILFWIMVLYIWVYDNQVNIWVPKISITGSNFNVCRIAGATIKWTEHTQSWLSII